MNCKDCGSKVWLKFNAKGVYKERFTCCCSNCKTEFLYESPTNRFEFANNDFLPIIDTFDKISKEEKEIIVTEIKVQMVEILNHFICCTWGAHYSTLFDKIIKIYLDNPYVLDYVLKSEIVRDIGLRGRTGAKIFPDLLSCLKQVNSSKIQQYLDSEFSNL